MNLISIQYGKKSIEFAINKYKLLLGFNYSLKYEIIKPLRNIHLKLSLSEFQIAHNHAYSISVNDKLLSNKHLEIYFVNSEFDLTNDLKMGTKSLLLKYLEDKMNNQSLYDEIHTLNILLQDIFHSINEGDTLFEFNPIEFTIKQIAKLAETRLLCDEYSTNELDLNFEEKILLQLNLIQMISTAESQKWHLLILDIQQITSKIIQTIDRLPQNCLCLILTNSLYFEDKVENVLYCGYNIFDCANETLIYEAIINRAPKYIEYQEVHTMLKEIFFNNVLYPNSFIIDLMNK